MTSLTDYADKRIEAERKLIAEWLREKSKIYEAQYKIGDFYMLQHYATAIERGDYSKALNAVSQPLMRQGPLAIYATYYTGVAQLQLGRPTEALRSFNAVRDQKPLGYLAEAAPLGAAAADEALLHSCLRTVGVPLGDNLTVE